MNHRFPTVAQLMGDDVTVIHRTKRPYFEKRLVEREGERYVMYRFAQRAQMELLAATLTAARSAGAVLQSVQSMTNVREEAQLGNWLTLSCLPGHLMTRDRFTSNAAASLGQTLARLHSLRGERWHSLFRRHKPGLPYYRFLQKVPLNSSESRWAEDSERKIRRIHGFNLAHGDLHSKNMLVGPDDKVALIDYELFAYEPLGLELATALLQPFCRSEKHRSYFLEAYLAASNAELRSVWADHAHALLFGAAIRSYDMRMRRIRFLKLRNRLLSARMWLGPRDGAETVREVQKNLQLINLAEMAGEVYQAQARNMAPLSLEMPRMDAIQLISALYAA